jgi:hypothetical protein
MRVEDGKRQETGARRASGGSWNDSLVKRLLAVGVCASVIGCSSGAQLIIVNESDHQLRDVVASGSGFSTQIGTVPPHSANVLTVYPRGESGLRLTFNADGKPIIFEQDGYFERCCGYLVTVNVSPSLAVSMKSELRKDTNPLTGRPYNN